MRAQWRQRRQWAAAAASSQRVGAAGARLWYGDARAERQLDYSTRRFGARGAPWGCWRAWEGWSRRRGSFKSKTGWWIALSSMFEAVSSARRAAELAAAPGAACCLPKHQPCCSP